MGQIYREYLKSLEKSKRDLYKKIFKASFKQGLLDNLEDKAVGIIRNDLEENKYGREMKKWFDRLAKIQLLSSSDPVPFDYLMSKKITMLYIEKVGQERVSFDTGIYTGINDIILDDTMSLDELLGTNKLRERYDNSNKKIKENTKQKENGFENHVRRITNDNVTKQNKKICLRSVKEAIESEIIAY